MKDLGYKDDAKLEELLQFQKNSLMLKETKNKEIKRMMTIKIVKVVEIKMPNLMRGQILQILIMTIQARSLSILIIRQVRNLALISQSQALDNLIGCTSYLIL